MGACGVRFLHPSALQATAALLGFSSSKKKLKAPLQLSLFPLQQSVACCRDLICPEEAWEQPLRWAV